MLTPRIWASLDPFLESGPVLGRIQANAGFLRGLLRVDPFDIYRFYLPGLSACQAQSAALAALAPDMWNQGRLQVLDRRQLAGSLSRDTHHIFHLSDCIVHPGPLAALRNAVSRHIFPITSVTHSLSYARYGLEMLKHLSPCTTSRDAVVATSRTASTVVRAYFDFLRRGYGLPQETHPGPSVERIPLGVDGAAFAPPAPEKRRELRAREGFGGETVFLILARLCHSSKMDFLPVLRAFQRLIMDKVPPDSMRLVLAGWNDEEDWGRKTLVDLAANIGLPLSVVERPSEERKRDLYAASDVFLSPSDNLQETFGLTLLEAQAAGLPVIASDFDGYRDLVAHGSTGILAPTLGPAATEAVDVMAPLTFDTHTHLVLAQRTVVDVSALALAIRSLTEDAPLREAMSRAALEHSREHDWAAVAGKYVALWEELASREVPQRPAATHPASVPYAEVFRAYPTTVLDGSVVLRASRLGNAVYRGQDFPLVHQGLSEVIDLRAVRALLVLARKPADATELCDRLMEAMPELDTEAAQAHVLWCCKHDLLERVHG